MDLPANEKFGMHNIALIVGYCLPFGRTNSVRAFASIWLAFVLLVTAGCGGTSSQPSSSGPLSGNWQVNMVADESSGATPLSAAGFIVQSNDSLSGSVEGPTTVSASGSASCGGVGPVSGTINGQNVSFSLNPGGTVFNFTGAISSDNTSMSGVFQAIPGPCTAAGTTGTWNAVLVPPLNGSFTGTLSGSTYMALLTGVTPVAPITVSGSITQSSNAGASNASLTGTITAVGYPCFTTVSLSGTISGTNVYLNVFNYNGEPIGFLGVPSSPATVVSNSGGGFSLVDNTIGNGLQLGIYNGTSTVGPCPPLWSQTNLAYQTSDNTAVQFDFQ